MILVLSDGSYFSQRLYIFLNSEEIPNIFHFSDFSCAGKFGKGSLVVGKPSYKGFKRVILKNDIDIIIDAIERPVDTASFAVMEAARELDVPVIKLMLPVLRIGDDVIKSIGAKVIKEYSYKKAAEIINNTVGNVLFLAQSHSVKAVCDYVFDLGALYALIKKGIEFDTELATAYGVPMQNVIDADNFSDASGIEDIVKRLDIRMIVTDSSSDLFAKLDAAKNMGINIMFISDMGIEYEDAVDNFEVLFEKLKSFSKTVNNIENVDEVNIDEDSD